MTLSKPTQPTRTFQTNRRAFVAAASGIAAAPHLANAAGEKRSPNDRIQIGVIGLGSRGYNLIDGLLAAHDRAQIVAIADVDSEHFRDRPWGTGTAFGLKPAHKKIAAAYKPRGVTGGQTQLHDHADYRELIQRSDVDAVVVATPDHWHALCTLEALRAGKEVYCEKPVTHTFAEGQLVYREASERKAVFQTGSQQRSDWRFRRAVELVRNGHLGDVTTVEVGLPPGYDKPQGETKMGSIPEHLDYDFWCGPAPKLPYMRARHHRWWRGHRAFGGGVLMDWIGHHNDIAHWAIGVDRSGPTQVEAVGWSFPDTDIYDTPQNYTIRCQYANEIVSTISTGNEQGLKIIGHDGWVYVNRGQLRSSNAQWIQPAFDPGEVKVYKSDDHIGNFLDCVRSRKACIAPAETAHRSITPGHLGYVSQAVGRALNWNAKDEIVVGDAEANQLLQSMPYRSPWTI